MNEQELLARVAAANRVPNVDTLPEGTIDVRTLRNYVANSPTVDADDAADLDIRPLAAASARPRRGLWLAVAGFVAVLALGIGFWLARSADEPDVVDPPQVTTTVPSTTTTPPTTFAIETGATVDPEVLGVIETFMTHLDEGNAPAAGALVTSPDATDLVDRIATAEQFDDEYALGGCLDFSGIVRCDVLVSDFFVEQLDLDPWPQTWEFDVQRGSIAGLAMSGSYPELMAAMSEFDAFVASREPAAPRLVDSEGVWVRSAGTVEAAMPHLVEFAALRSGIPAETWATVAAYFETLSAGDLDAFELLLAPGASFEERSGPTGELRVSYTRDEPQFMGHFWFEYIGLKTDTHPLKCTGDGVSVACRVRNIGVLQLDRGGFDDGLLTFDFEDGTIASIRDAFNVFSLRPGFFDRWIYDNGPDMSDQWNGTTTDIPETPDVARLLLEWYPRYLADTGVEVPPEFLDGSLIDY